MPARRDRFPDLASSGSGFSGCWAVSHGCSFGRCSAAQPEHEACAFHSSSPPSSLPWGLPWQLRCGCFARGLAWPGKPTEAHLRVTSAQ